MSIKLRILVPINDLNRDSLTYKKTILRPDAVKWSEAM